MAPAVIAVATRAGALVGRTGYVKGFVVAPPSMKRMGQGVKIM